LYHFRQQEAEDELNIVLKELRTKQKMLADVEERLQKLENIYDQSLAEKNKLESNINRTQARLKRSDLLVVALSDEQRRWETNIKVCFYAKEVVLDMKNLFSQSIFMVFISHLLETEVFNNRYSIQKKKKLNVYCLGFIF